MSWSSATSTPASRPPPAVSCLPVVLWLRRRDAHTFEDRLDLQVRRHRQTYYREVREGVLTLPPPLRRAIVFHPSLLIDSSYAWRGNSWWGTEQISHTPHSRARAPRLSPFCVTLHFLPPVSHQTSQNTMETLLMFLSHPSSC